MLEKKDSLVVKVTDMLTFVSHCWTSFSSWNRSENSVSKYWNRRERQI